MKKISGSIVLTLAVALITLSLSAPAFAGRPLNFGVDALKVKVGEGNGSATWSTGQHSLAVLGNNVYATWASEGIWYSLSNDGGRLWGKSNKISSTSASGSSIAVGNDGVIHIVWDESSSIRYWNSSGVSSTVNGAIQGSWSTSVAVDSNGTVHVAWNSSSDDIYVSDSSDGLIWNITKINGSNPDHKGNVPSIASDSNGNLYMAWQCYDICYSQKMSSGSWTASSMIAGIYGEPSVDASDSGRVFIGLPDWYRSSPAVAYSDNGGSSWNIVEVETPQGIYNMSTSIIVSPNGDVNIAYTEYEPTNDCAGYGTYFERSTDGGASWNGSRFLIACGQRYPTLAADQESKALIMWGGMYPNPNVITFTREQ